MERVIWVAGWEMQCCGEPFSVGSRVTWQVGRRDLDWLVDNVLGPDAPTVTDWYEGHPADEAGLVDATGTVGKIDAVFCRYAPRPGGNPKFRSPVPGSATIEARTKANGWEPENEEARFAGYVVTVTEP